MLWDQEIPEYSLPYTPSQVSGGKIHNILYERKQFLKISRSNITLRIRCIFYQKHCPGQYKGTVHGIISPSALPRNSILYSQVLNVLPLLCIYRWNVNNLWIFCGMCNVCITYVILVTPSDCLHQKYLIINLGSTSD